MEREKVGGGSRGPTAGGAITPCTVTVGFITEEAQRKILTQLSDVHIIQRQEMFVPAAAPPAASADCRCSPTTSASHHRSSHFLTSSPSRFPTSYISKHTDGGYARPHWLRVTSLVRKVSSQTAACEA